MITSSSLGAFSVAAGATAPVRAAASPDTGIAKTGRGAEQGLTSTSRPPMDPQARRGSLLDISA